ncbi:HTH Tnp Tc3 2 domain containing protein, partial [Asbolus verrucosus]
TLNGDESLVCTKPVYLSEKLRSGALYFEYGLHGTTKVENITEVVADVPVPSANVKSTAFAAKLWVQEIGGPVSLSTVYRKIETFGLHSYRPTRHLPLTVAQKTARLQLCRVGQNWTDEWDRIIFSDESHFCLWRNDGRIRVRRFRGERRNLGLVVRGHICVTPGIMVWDTI